MDVMIGNEKGNVTFSELKELFNSVGWETEYQGGNYYKSVCNSNIVLGARSGGKLVGLLTGMYDGYMTHVSFFAIHKNYQRKNVGSRLFKYFLSSYGNENQRVILSTCNASGFYKKFGFAEISHCMSLNMPFDLDSGVGAKEFRYVATDGSEYIREDMAIERSEELRL